MAIKEKFNKQTWINFAIATIKNDERIAVPSNLEKFGDLMEAVYKKYSLIESGLWQTVNPCGTEDRTWVRTFLAMEGFEAYKGMFDGLDGSHAKLIRKQFKSVSV